MLIESIQIVLVKYDEICKVLEPPKQTKGFSKLFLSNVANIKERLDSLDADIVAELKTLTFSLQAASFTLQTQTLHIATDLQNKIINLYGGQEGPLSNEMVVQEVATTIGGFFESAIQRPGLSARNATESFGPWHGSG
ncbi:hypothetical protein EON63_04490 [archaeon]|nr:MAG: hypothetical protein EON63_04490 [archaeon]